MNTKFLLLFFCIAFHPRNTEAQQIVFQKTYGDSLQEGAIDLKETLDGGYILVGGSNSSNPSSSFYNPDVYLVKTDSAGNMEWNKTFGSTGADVGVSVIQTADSSYLVLGRTVQPFRINGDFYFLKVSKDGNLIASYFSGADGALELPSMIIKTSDGGFVTAGDAIPGFGANQNFFVLKFDQNLDTVFSNCYGDSVGQSLVGIAETYDHGFICTGSGLNFETVRLDSAGNIIWSKAYHTSTNTIIFPLGIKQAADSNFVIAGVAYNLSIGDYKFYLLKIDSAGAVIWSNTYGGSADDYAYGFTQTNSGNFIMTGGTSSFGFTNGGGYIIEIDPNGNLLWSKVITSSYHLSSVVSNDDDGSFAVSGETGLFGSGQSDMVLMKADSTSNFGCNEIIVNSITTSVITTDSIVNFNTLGGTHLGFAIADTASVNLTTTICFGTGIDELSEYEGSLSVYPNPFFNRISLSFSESKNENILMKIFDSVGQLFFTKNILQTNQDVNLNSLPKGIYFLTVKSEEYFYSKKIVKM